MHGDCRSSQDSEAARAFKRRQEELLFARAAEREALRFPNTRRLTITEAARIMGVSSERTFKYLNPEAENSFRAYLLPLWHLRVEPQLLQEVCAESGGVFVPCPEMPSNPIEGISAAAEVLKQASEATQVFLEALADKRLTKREFEAIIRETQDVIAAALAVRLIAQQLYREEERHA